MKERKRKKSSRLEQPQSDYNSSADDVQEETPHQTSADDTITKLSQLEKLYEEKQKVKNTLHCYSLTSSWTLYRCCSLQCNKERTPCTYRRIHSLLLIHIFMHWIIHKLKSCEIMWWYLVQWNKYRHVLGFFITPPSTQPVLLANCSQQQLAALWETQTIYRSFLNQGVHTHQHGNVYKFLTNGIENKHSRVLNFSPHFHNLT